MSLVTHAAFHQPPFCKVGELQFTALAFFLYYLKLFYYLLVCFSTPPPHYGILKPTKLALAGLVWAKRCLVF